MNAKRMAAEKSLEFLSEGMTIGLGTGSTVYWAIKGLGQMVKEGFRIHAIPTSKATEKLASDLAIPLKTFAEVNELDLTIDGADEVSPRLDLIKGAGGALLREKLVASASRRLIIVAEATKRVTSLGRVPLPVEVVPFAWQTTVGRIRRLNCVPSMRTHDDQPFITDNGNYIFDCACGLISDPAAFNRELKLLPGVVETGLFIQLADIAILADEEQVEVIERADKSL